VIVPVVVCAAAGAEIASMATAIHNDNFNHRMNILL
jgi:hypothetical protein